MYSRRLSFAFLLFPCALLHDRGSASEPRAPTIGLCFAQGAFPSLQVTGVVKQALTLTADDLAKMPRATVKTASSGMETVYEGVWLHEVLKRAGAPQGPVLRGKALAGYVLAEAQDGYQVVFSLGELDPAFKDKPGARSVRMLTKLEVVQLRK